MAEHRGPGVLAPLEEFEGLSLDDEVQHVGRRPVPQHRGLPDPVVDRKDSRSIHVVQETGMKLRQVLLHKDIARLAGPQTQALRAGRDLSGVVDHAQIDQFLQMRNERELSEVSADGDIDAGRSHGCAGSVVRRRLRLMLRRAEARRATTAPGPTEVRIGVSRVMLSGHPS